MPNTRLGADVACASWPGAVDGCKREVVQWPPSLFHSCTSVSSMEEAPSPSVEVNSCTTPSPLDEVLSSSSSLEVTTSPEKQVF